MRKFFLIVVLSFCCTLLLSAQEKKPRVTINLSNVSLEEVLSAIEQQTSYHFSYRDVTVDKTQDISLVEKNVVFTSVLDEILPSKNLTYHIISNSSIIIARMPVQKNRQKDEIVHGNIIDINGNPIVGATLQIKGSSIWTVSDDNGNFKLKMSSGQTLVVSFLGFISQNIVISKENNLKIILKEDKNTLDDVVVIGYGTVRKRDLTGAISSVKGEDLELAGVSSIGHALEGKAAGMYVRQNSAQPGGGLDILIRGAGSINASNAPLYIVDGFPIAQLSEMDSGDQKMNSGTQSILNFINPNDIASVEVLKDASATAIYGARAANGVVIISTKRGIEGKAKVNYTYNYSFQKYSDTYDLLSLPEWMEEKNATTWELWVWNNRVGPWGTRTLENAITSPVNGLLYKRPYTDQQIANASEGTDWLGLITRNGQIKEHNVSIQGGNEDTKYMVSFNYYDNKGIVKNSGMTRYTLKSNIDQKVLNIFNVGLNLTLSRIKNENTQLGSSQYENSGLIRSAIQMGPNIKAYDEETGTYPVNPLLGTQPNPYSLLNNKDNGNIDRLLGNVFIEAKPIDGLKIRLNAGIDHANINRNTYQPTSTLNGSNLGGVATISNGNNNQYLLEATANYNKTFNDIHKISFLVGMSYEEFNYETSNLGNNNFLTDSFIYYNMSAGAGNKIVGSGFTKNKMLSYFFRSNYILKDRYLMTFTLRGDGASVFAKNNKWGYFPSIALGWAINKESFMQETKDWLDLLKFRVSWGQTGNADISTNAYASYYAAEAWNCEDKSKQIGVFQGRLDNPDLKWETTTEWNFGLDFSFLNSRISGSVEYYNKIVSDLLNFKSLNSYQEITQVIANVGKTKNTGLEITLNTRNIVSSNFFWATDFTYTKYQDNWKERTPDWKPAVYEQEDAPVRAIYSRRADHIMQIGEETPEAQPLLVPGQMVIKDLNGYVRDGDGNPVVDENGRFQLTGEADGIIDDADAELIGTTDPGFIMGMTNRFKYKDFDLSFSMNGMFDRKMMDPTEMEYGISGDGVARYGYNALRSIKNRWTWDNPSTTNPSTFNGWNNNYTSGDFYYQNAWFIRLQNITFGYSLPSRLLAKTKYISKLRLHASINNLFVITPYDGLDPETDLYTASYPNARTFNFGVNITF